VTFVQRALTELAAYTPSDAAQKEALRSIVAVLDTVSEPHLRSTLAPGHLTASAVLRDPTAGRVLLISHEKIGRWLQPGGHIELSDRSLLDAARREVAEEVGSLAIVNRGIVDVDIHQIPGFDVEPPHLHFDVRFLVDVGAGRPVVGPGSLGYRWVCLADIDSLDTDDSVVRLLHKALA